MSSPSLPPTSDTAVFTIAAKNYLHYARVLMRSVERVSPGFDRYLLLADRIDGAFDPASEPFRVVEAETLSIPDVRRFTFRYTILELNTAVKPWFFRDLFARGYRKVIYLDPDIFVYQPLRDVEAALDAGALAVLVPHLTGRLLDGRHPGELEILQSGAYNLGFLALARHGSLEGLLDFWCEKSLRDFAVDVSRGLFTDQRWMDLVPGMFADVAVLRHDGYDVAYWNLPHRRVERCGSTYSVNGAPLIFFHFSGIDPDAPEQFSKHQNRYRLSTAGPAADLARAYAAALDEAGRTACARLPYAYGALDDGSPIPDAVRRLCRTNPEVEAWAGDNPFARTAADWNEPLDAARPPLTRVMLAVYQARSELRLTWPDVMGADRAAFARWFAEAPELEDAVARCYVLPWQRGPVAGGTRRSARARPIAPLTLGLVTGAARKAWVAFREGRLALSPRRWLQLFRLHTMETAQAGIGRASPPLPPMVWPPGTPAPSPPKATAEPSGLTIVGYVTDGTGVAASAHGSVLACDAAGIRQELIDARPLDPCRGTYPVSLLHVNADQTAVIAGLLGDGFFRGRYTIGCWAWELEHLPDGYAEAFAWVDEVWAPSGFIQQAVAEQARVPAVRMPYTVTVEPTAGFARASGGLDPSAFLFLVMYDALSVQERKNPLGAIAAFRQAFPQPRGVGLVVRVNHASTRPDEVAIVRRAVEDTPGAVLIDRPMSRADAQALQASCDAFVSLHRSEGFGLNIAEAMLSGKPVVATGWSGNMDFTTPWNACLVDYTLVTLDRDHGPYRRGNRWAEPDVAQASAFMQRLVEDAVYRHAVAERGRRTVATEFSPEAVGRRYRARLDAIRLGRSRSATLRGRI
jgi:Glycosyl transferases group 1